MDDLTLRGIAKRIPDQYRIRILKENIIFKAIAQPGDPHMTVLFVVWVNYVDSSLEGKMDCSFCVGLVLTNFRNLQQELIELQKEYELFNND